MIKQPHELALLAESGRLLASVFEMLDKLPLQGMSTLEVDSIVDKFITHDLQARPASKGQYNYPFVLNASIDNVICHGVPSQSDILREGAIVNFDITLEKEGFIADSSKTYLVGDVSVEARRLVRTTYEAMWEGIYRVRPGAFLGDIGWAIEKHAKRSGFSVVREFCGHGIGREMHEEPQILHYGKRNTGLVMREGMVFTIEPMLNQGGRSIKQQDDGWTITTRDGSLSAQFEHTVSVTATGFSVLTLGSNEKGMLNRR
ncbi:type I methionyl aminopeptidase [Rouxiella silvae]|uniref:Methionine aminopeptidase n=1 Tax=Rouxiella silvae TaxID=1646373 RepID=A0AA41BYK1_9GAMM|nr:type I methionyl aminopeptidase [Rouxiella silvae]MBF6639252.1 type I methionyl aminopeptidase [Rouxiella silvae]